MASRPVNLKWGSVRFVVIWMVSESRLIRNDRKVRCFFEAEWICLGLGWTAQWSPSVALVQCCKRTPNHRLHLSFVEFALRLHYHHDSLPLRCGVASLPTKAISTLS